MRKLVLAVFVAVVTALCVCGCSGGGSSGQAPQGPKALSQAYDALQAADFSSKSVEATYDEGTDTLNLVLGGEDSTVDEVFDIIDEAVNGKDIGTLGVYIEWGHVPDTGIAAKKEAHEKVMLPELSKRVGALPCKSLECLNVGRMVRDLGESGLYDGAWTSALQKTDTLKLGVWGGTYTFSQYTQDEQGNLANVKRLEVGNRYEGGDYAMLPNVEELVFSAGDDQEEMEKVANTGLVWKSDLRDHIDDLADLTSVKRVIFFPELESWDTSSDYYEFLMALQASHPDALTNEPGKGWSGDESALMSVADIDVRSAVGDKNYDAAKESLLKVAAKSAFKEGQGFSTSSGQPKLDGPTLVYQMENPYKLEWSDYGQFSTGGKVLIDEFNGTGVQMPTESFQFNYLVYAYPTFTEVGVYESGTPAYSTTLHAQVYDMKNKVKYDSVELETIQPPETRILSYTERYAPDASSDTVVAYVVGLK